MGKAVRTLREKAAERREKAAREKATREEAELAEGEMGEGELNEAFAGCSGLHFGKAHSQKTTSGRPVRKRVPPKHHPAAMRLADLLDIETAEPTQEAADQQSGDTTSGEEPVTEKTGKAKPKVQRKSGGKRSKAGMFLV